MALTAPNVRSVWGLIALFSSVLGTMLVLSLATWRSYYVDRLTIRGSLVSLVTLLQNQQFDTIEIQGLKWPQASGGYLRIQLPGSKAWLGLSAYTNEEQLQLIRWFWSVVPEDRQENWPRFCDRVAIPLRDGVRLSKRRLPPENIVHITPAYFDRSFLIGFPITLALAIGLGMWLKSWTTVVLPLMLVVLWIFARFSTPQKGMTDERLTWTSPQGRIGLLLCLGIVLPKSLILGMNWLGFPREIVFGTPIASMLLILFFAFREVRQIEKNDREVEEPLAVEAWEEKEKSLASSDSVPVA